MGIHDQKYSQRFWKMQTILEQQRSTHETIDRLENLAASLLLDVPRTYRERLAQHHRVANFAIKVVNANQNLLSVYDDVNQVRTNDLNLMSGDNAVPDFYRRLSQIYDYHQRNPDEELLPMELEFMNPDSQPNDIEILDPLFSGEEFYGRFVDLHLFHDTFINLQSNLLKSSMPKPKINSRDASSLLNSLTTTTNPDTPAHQSIRPLSYSQYLDALTDFDLIPMEHKLSPYRQYIHDLRSYLENFINRAHPLFDLCKVNDHVLAEFESGWSTKQSFLDWHQFIDVTAVLYCNVCAKQFTKQHAYERHLVDKRHKKAVLAAHHQAGHAKLDKRAEFESNIKTIAKTEYLIVKLVNEYLLPVIQATKEYIERKQTLTEMELGQELESMDQLGRHLGNSITESNGIFNDHEEIGGGDEDEDDEEEEKIYNPLKLPLGWDGKPIPYWLYKLHGLGVEYSCEICGGYVYMGRKAFERHFQEFRHTIGMKSLGIPNNKQFQEITRIEDALGLWEKIQMNKMKTQFRPELEAEYEDSTGNVMSRKVYQDLQRQGLL